MRRIFKPSPTPPWRGFSLVTDCQLETQVASARPFIPQGGQEGGLIRRIGFIREPFERMRTEPKAKEHNKGYCLPDSSLLLSYNPETSSRVTLALLGTVFQTDN